MSVDEPQEPAPYGAQPPVPVPIVAKSPVSQPDDGVRRSHTKRRREWYGFEVTIGLLVLCGVGTSFLCFGNAVSRSTAIDPSQVKVGDCLRLTTVNEQDATAHARVLDCGDGLANYQVIGLDGEKTEAQFHEDPGCHDFPQTEEVYFTGAERLFGEGKVICLAPNH